MGSNQVFSDPYTANAYRLLGRTVDEGPPPRMPASPAELGPLLTFEGLGPAPRTEAAVAQAVATLKDPAAEGREAVTWFRLDTASDREAWTGLLDGDLDAAQKCWEQAGDRSAEENLAVLQHIRALAEPEETSGWVSALACLSQAASGGNVHRQELCGRVLGELVSQIRAAAGSLNSRRMMQLLHVVGPYLDDADRVALEQELFKRDLDRVRLECAELRAQLMGASKERVAELEKRIGTQVVPQVERLIQTGLPGPAEAASREAALIYRSLGRAWGSLREWRERSLALESAFRYATADLRNELSRELDTARLDSDYQEETPVAPRTSSEQLPPAPAADRGWSQVATLPRTSTILGTGTRLRRMAPEAHYEARYDVTVLGVTVFPLRRYRVVEDFPGQPTRIDALALSADAIALRVLAIFLLCLLLLVGAGAVLAPRGPRATEAQRQALSRQVDELLEQVSLKAQRLHRLETELEEVTQQEKDLAGGGGLAQVRARRSRLEAEREQVKAEHEKLLARLYELERKRQSLR